MSLNFGQIPPLTTELAALERLKNRCHHVISVDIDLIFFKLAGNKDMHNIMDEFEFRPERTTDYRVSCPLVYLFLMPLYSFLSLSFLGLLDHIPELKYLLILSTLDCHMKL